MGIGIVLMFWVMLGLVLASMGGVVLAAAVALLTMRVQRGRWVAVGLSFFFPFLCVAWVLAAFVGQALINDTVFHRDPGLGDSWYTPLPNGYMVQFIDVFDHGTLYDPVIAARDHATADGQEGTINEVRTAQLAGSLILGCADHPAIDSKITRNHCFILDTRTHKRTDFADEKALRSGADQLGIKLELKPLSDIYAANRSTWFDGVVLAVTLAVPLVGFVLLCRWVLRLRRRRIPRS